MREAAVGSAEAQLCTEPSMEGLLFFGCSVIGLNLIQTPPVGGVGGEGVCGGRNRSLKSQVREIMGQPRTLHPFSFEDNDSSKGQRSCTSSHHAITVHRKHFLLLFFLLNCFTDIYVFFFL